MSGLDIHVFVTDHAGSGQVDVQIVFRSKQHAGTWLSAIASGIRRMWTDINCIEPGSVAREFGMKDIVNLVDHCFVEKAASDSGLVRDQYRFHSALIDSANRRT